MHSINRLHFQNWKEFFFVYYHNSYYFGNYHIWLNSNYHILASTRSKLIKGPNHVKRVVEHKQLNSIYTNLNFEYNLIHNLFENSSEEKLEEFYELYCKPWIITKKC